MRIVALSDQHGYLPDIPPCDLLIVAGDVCPDRFGPFMAVHDPYQQQAWFDRTVRPWLAATPATHKLLTWGNHDWCGQMCSFRSDTEPGAWEFIADLLEAGSPMLEIKLDTPAGKTGYVVVASGGEKRPDIYVKLQLGSGKV